MINKNNTLTALGSLLLLNTATEEEAGIPGQKPNILFIAVDDLRPELGCYGVKEAITPNIDRLASKGMVFTNHFVQVPTCGASRCALLTGRRPSESGGLTNHALLRGKSRLLPELKEKGAQSFPELFRRNDYHTVCIGKLSHMPDGKIYEYSGKGSGQAELFEGWSELSTPYGEWNYGWGAFFGYGDGVTIKKTGKIKGYRRVEFPDVKDNELPDGLICDAAIKKIDEIKDKPFLLGVGFFKPHLPFVAPKKYFDLYEGVDIKLAPVQSGDGTAYGNHSGEFKRYTGREKAQKGPMTAKDQRYYKRAYYACVSYIDAQVGKLMAKLEKEGLDKNTIIVLWGDHGWNLGDHNSWGKHTPLEKPLRSPLIIVDPCQKTTGKTEAIVETLDIYPTLVDLCQLRNRKTVHNLAGVSLKPVLQNVKHPGKNAAISYWGDMISLRTARYRLVYRKGKRKSFELYDHNNDPHEAKNIAGEKPEIVNDLLRLIKEDDPRLISVKNKELY